ncbi:MAG: MarR family transcriptional regulator [Pseudomonadota bacterium]
METNEHQTLLMTLMALNAGVLKKLNSRLSVHGLGWSDYQVLQALAAEPKQTLRRIDLAERVGLTASGVTRLLNPMEKIGLVAKQASERDARVSLVSLTEAGALMLSNAQVTVDELAQSLLCGLSVGRQHDLVDLLGDIAIAPNPVLKQPISG